MLGNNKQHSLSSFFSGQKGKDTKRPLNNDDDGGEKASYKKLKQGILLHNFLLGNNDQLSFSDVDLSGLDDELDDNNIANKSLKSYNHTNEDIQDVCIAGLQYSIA